MTYRRFCDRSGTDWEVWQITPAGVDRRRSERRAEKPRRSVAAVQLERRVGDRRVAYSPGFSRVSRGFEKGWLCFAAGLETRRLAPIPRRWLEASPEQLELLVACCHGSLEVLRSGVIFGVERSIGTHREWAKMLQRFTRMTSFDFSRILVERRVVDGWRQPVPS